MTDKRSILDRIRDGLPQCHESISCSIGYLEEHLKCFNVDMDPPYQRGHVWTKRQQSLFMGSLLEDPSRIPPFYLNRKGGREGNDHEILDGKQRVRAIQDWFGELIPAITPGGWTVCYHDFVNGKHHDHTGLRLGVTLYWKIVILDPKEVLRFYLALNSGGTPHSDEELQRVRGMLEQ